MGKIRNPPKFSIITASCGFHFILIDTWAKLQNCSLLFPKKFITSNEIQTVPSNIYTIIRLGKYHHIALRNS